MRNILICLFLSVFPSVGFSVDRKIEVQVEDRIFEFHESSFQGLEDTFLYKKIFESKDVFLYKKIFESKSTVNLTGVKGVHLNTFEGIYFSLEKDSYHPESGKRKLPKWFAAHKDVSFDVLHIVSSYLNPMEFISLYSPDLKTLGLYEEIDFDISDWSKVRIESFDGQDYIYYVLTVNDADADFEFVEVPGEVASENYFMMSHWVTQGQWFAVMGENPAYFAGRELGLPMENISFDDIVNDFLPRLNNLLLEAGFEGKFKLPSSDQWQRMADKNVALNFMSNKLKYSDFRYLNEQPLSVKSKVRGDLGAWMFGSVWEWVGTVAVSDWVRADAPGLVSIRGGSLSKFSELVGPSARRADWSNSRDRSIGFRLLRTYPGQA